MSDERNWPTIYERVRNIIADTLQIPLEMVTPNAHLREDLDADSLDLIELNMAIAREFATDVFSHIDPYKAESLEPGVCQIATVGQLVECLELWQSQADMQPHSILLRVEN
jgi:acyl carrier protein